MARIDLDHWAIARLLLVYVCTGARATSSASLTARPRWRRSIREDDGGVSQTCEGALAVAGVWYRFICHVFVDRGGERFLSNVSEFEAVEWRTRLAMPN